MPGIFVALLWLVLIVVAIGIVWWALQRAPIPPPFRWVIDVLIAIVALVLLFGYVAPMLLGAPHLR